MSKPLVAANWKMNLLESEAISLAESFKPLGAHADSVDVWVSCSPEHLRSVQNTLADNAVQVGAQNCAAELKGAFTGEVSAASLRDMGIAFTLIGHSERRSIFGESDDNCATRAHAALEQGVSVVFCVGETLEERESGATIEVVIKQLTPFLERLTPEQRASVVIAYEPVWAIGTGKVATTEQIEETHAQLKAWLAEAHKWEQVTVLYGGSVKPENFTEICALPSVDGALVGGASLKADSFGALVEIAAASEKAKAA